MYLVVDVVAVVVIAGIIRGGDFDCIYIILAT